MDIGEALGCFWVTFVKHDLEKKHVEMIANMTVPDKVHGKYNM